MSTGKENTWQQIFVFIPSNIFIFEYTWMETWLETWQLRFWFGEKEKKYSFKKFDIKISDIE